MTEKRFNLRAGYYDEYTGICGGNDENFTTNEVVDLLNDQDERIKNLEKQNEELIQVIKGISKDSADAISRIWSKDIIYD